MINKIKAHVEEIPFVYKFFVDLLLILIMTTFLIKLVLFEGNPTAPLTICFVCVYLSYSVVPKLFKKPIEDWKDKYG